MPGTDPRPGAQRPTALQIVRAYRAKLGELPEDCTMSAAAAALEKLMGQREALAFMLAQSNEFQPPE